MITNAHAMRTKKRIALYGMTGINNKRVSLMPQENSPIIDPTKTILNKRHVFCDEGTRNACGSKIPSNITFNKIEIRIVKKRNSGVLKKASRINMIVDLCQKYIYTTTSLSRYKSVHFFNIFHIRGKYVQHKSFSQHSITTRSKHCFLIRLATNSLNWCAANCSITY